MRSSQLHTTFPVPVTNNGQHIKIVQLTVIKVNECQIEALAQAEQMY